MGIFDSNKFIRYGSSMAIAKAGTYEELLGTKDIRLGPKTLERFASVIPISQYSDKYLYVIARAVSGHEKWGSNENSDSFEWQELLKSYPTFIRGGVYKDHNNRDPRDAVGIIVDAWPNIEEQYIDVLMAINKQKAPKEVRLIQKGQLDSVSMGCTRENTTISNPFGPPRMIKDVEVYQKVLTHTGDVRRVLQTFKRQYSGDFYKVRILGLPSYLELTPEHPVVSIKRSQLDCVKYSDQPSYRSLCIPDSRLNKRCKKKCGLLPEREFEIGFTAISDLQKGDFVGIPFPTKVETPKWVTKDFARLLGYYLAEGSLRWSISKEYEPKTVPRGVGFSFHIDETHLTQEIVDICGGLSTKKPFIQKDVLTNSANITILDASLAKTLLKLGNKYSHTKRLAEEVLFWDPKLQLELIGAFIDGDGYVTKEHAKIGFSTSSEVLAKQLCMLLSRNNIIWSLSRQVMKASTNIDRRGKVLNFKESIEWRVVLGSQESTKLESFTSKVLGSPKVKKRSPRKFFYKNYLFSPIAEVTTYPYSGNVYNLEVEGDHSYVANGVAVHNCVVDEATCSVCGNIARDESEYCEHIRNGCKGKEVNGKKCFEFNRGVRFFEVSLISPWSEAADPDAKIRQTLVASKADTGFEDWIMDYESEDNVKEADILGDRLSDWHFGESVLTKDGKEGIVVGSEGDYPKIVIEGSTNPQVFDPNTITRVKEEEFEMAKKAEELTKVAQGETAEEHGMDNPMRGNPTTGKWSGDYQDPSEKFKQDYNRTEVPSDEVDLRGSQVSSQIEKPDYLHKGNAGGGTEGVLPGKKASVEDLEKAMESHIEDAAETALVIEEVRQQEAAKRGWVSRFKSAVGLEKDAAEEYGMESPNRGNPSTMKDAGDYQESSKYYDAQKGEGDVKADETKKDIDAQRPVTYSNTPENIYSKMPKVAAMAPKEIADKVKEIFKDVKEAQDFVKTIQDLKKDEAEDLLEMLGGMKEEEEEELGEEPKEKGKEKTEAPKFPPVKPMPPVAGPKPPVAGPKPPMAGPTKPGPMTPPGTLPPKFPLMGASVQHIRLAIAHKRLAALGDWGNEDPVAHAKRMILQQITRDPKTDIDSMFALAVNVRNLDANQRARLATELNMPGYTKMASIDYSQLTGEELTGAYKVLEASAAPPEALNEVLKAMVQKGVKASPQKVAASYADVVNWITDGMRRGKSYPELKREAEEKFQITDSSNIKDKEPAMGPGGSFMPGKGDSSELGHKEPSDGQYLGSGTPAQPALWAGKSSREMDERTIGRSSSVERTAAGELNDYDITYGTSTKWNASSKALAESANTEQKKDFGSELKEARKKELIAREAIEVEGGKSLGQWVSDLKKNGAPAKAIRQFQHIWKSALDDGKSASYAARAAIDKLPKEYLKKPTKEHGPGKSGPKSAVKTAVSEGHWYDLGDTIAPKAPTSGLAGEANREQDTQFKQELKQSVGVRRGQPINVVAGTGESYMATVAEVAPELETIFVDYEGGIRNRDAINLKAGKSKVFGEVKVYLRPGITTVKKGSWLAYGDGKNWNVYNFQRSASKLFMVKLADVDPEDAVKDFSLESVDKVPEFFASEQYGNTVLDQIAEQEAQGAFDEVSETGVASMSAGIEDGEIAVGSEVVMDPDWLPTGEETEELVGDIVQLKNDTVPGTVEGITATGEYRVNFGGGMPIILRAAEIKLAKDSNLQGTDVRWTDESKAQADDANSEQVKEFQKEQVLSALGPDSRHNTVMASKNVGNWEEPIQFMRVLIKDAGLNVKEALVPTIETFKMTEEDTNDFVGSDEYVEAFEMPTSVSKTGDPEFGQGKEVVQMRTAMAGMKKRLCIRIAEDMANRGMIADVLSDTDPETREKAIEREIKTLMELDDRGLYKFEEAVKSATDPDGVEALRRSAAKIGPEPGTLQQPLVMRTGTKGSKNDLDNPEFFM